jgi:hypothetical protein
VDFLGEVAECFIIWDNHFAIFGRLDSHDHSQQGSFSAAVFPDQSDTVFLIDDKAGIPEQGCAAELYRYILDGEQGDSDLAGKIKLFCIKKAGRLRATGLCYRFIRAV